MYGKCYPSFPEEKKQQKQQKTANDMQTATQYILVHPYTQTELIV